jgi:hypothetical protein
MWQKVLHKPMGLTMKKIFAPIAKMNSIRVQLSMSEKIDIMHL